MTLLPVFVALVVGWVALRGFLTYPFLPGWTKAVALCSAPVAALAWLAVMTADDPFLFPETAPCPAEPLREGFIGSGAVRGVSTAFPPRAYCLWEDGTTYDLATGAVTVFWGCFSVTAVSLALGLGHALRRPRALLQPPRRGAAVITRT
ncbi:hypothetical protein [Streptomyces sp.]|uniref:hypothetical protein n=1 Tax=Streptomyces sp. TaxID=1931 RepID=UPI002D595EFE|nr:hypothetical protein [Streptomyces sp.]HZF88456.1 hypothetical protein [Streptomyces sp.]